MRSMVRRAAVFITAIVLGVLTTIAVAGMALIGADRSQGGSSTLLIRNDTELWLVRRHRGFGLEWINCELSWPPLANPAPTMIDLPWWAIPPQKSWGAEAVPRFATLAVGWPAPFIIRQWTALRQSEIFPLPVELDDGADSLRRAAGRFMESDPGRPRPILWRGAILDAGLFSLGWLVAWWLVAALFRGLRGKERNDDADEHEERRGQPRHSQEHLHAHDRHL